MSQNKKNFQPRGQKNKSKPKGKQVDRRQQGSDTRRSSKKDLHKNKSSHKINVGTNGKGGLLFGTHAVLEALRNPNREHHRLIGTQKALQSDAVQEALAACAPPPTVMTIDREEMESLLPPGAVHQGLVLDCAPLEDVFLKDILVSASDEAKVVVLDQVTDPHNVGAILRSACVFGAQAVVMQKQHAPDITGILAKTACGAVEHVPIVRVVNLGRALKDMQEAGFFCFGLDERGETTIAQQSLSGKTALVMGAEGPGLRRLVADSCDVLVKLPAQGPIASLNVSNAAAVALYELVRQ